MLEKKKQKMEKLIERYYGKRDLLATWEARGNDHGYLVDLARRVRGHHMDILYRGGDVDPEV